MGQVKVLSRTAIPALRSRTFLKVKSGRKSVMSLKGPIRPVKGSLRLRGSFTQSHATLALAGRRSSWQFCSRKRESNSPRRRRREADTPAQQSESVRLTDGRSPRPPRRGEGRGNITATLPTPPPPAAVSEREAQCGCPRRCRGLPLARRSRRATCARRKIECSHNH